MRTGKKPSNGSNAYAHRETESEKRADKAKENAIVTEPLASDLFTNFLKKVAPVKIYTCDKIAVSPPTLHLSTQPSIS